MPHRRGFLKAVAGAGGVVAAGCSLLLRAGQAVQPATGARRRVTIGGRRVTTVDVHSHCAVPEALAMMKLPAGSSARWDSPQLMIGPERLRVMDEQGIDVEALSINPFWYAAEHDLARQIIQVQNEKLAALCSAYPGRFVAFATVALQHPDLAAQQLEDGKKLGLRGAAIGGNINGEEISARRFDPFWAKAEELGAPIFIHPQGIPELQKRFQGNGYLTNVIGNPLETTIALSHLIFDGTLDRFPGLKICAAHGGGYLPSYSARSDHGCATSPPDCSPTPLKKHPSEYLRQLYFDSLVFTPEALRHLVAECGASQIVLGTDWPFPWTTTAVDHILATPGLSADQKRAMLGATASKLLGISAA
ncbi:MAG TPA: amidohydrolase family protein [Bryobacteraceae bacterium]|nr:amidohydrolase family protein [Bryobacteraceae bacterium]